MRSGRDFYHRNDPHCARCYRVIAEEDSPISCRRCNAEDEVRKKEEKAKEGTGEPT